MGRFPNGRPNIPAGPPPNKTLVTVEALMRVLQGLRLPVPWPPMQVGRSGEPVASRAEVVKWLETFRKDFAANGLGLAGFVWSVHKDQLGQLQVFLFREDCVPYSAGAQWTFRELSDDPPPDEQWEVTFPRRVEQPAAPAQKESMP